MSVIRVVKNKNYTVMSNYHLKDKRLSFKAKGLLSMCLSLPDDWNYSIAGLVKISKEGKESVTSTLKELEKEGYLKRKKIRDERGRIVDVEYTITEFPVNPCPNNPEAENQDMENQNLGSQDMGTPYPESQTELNTDIPRTDTQTPDHHIGSDQKSGNKRKAFTGQSALDWRMTKQQVEKQIDYSCLISDYPMSNGEIDEFVMLIVDALCSIKPTLRVNGEDRPAGMVKERLKMLRYDHIKYVLDSLHNTTTQTKKPNQYLLTALYNAPTTINNYYSAAANHDMYGGNLD